MTDITELAQSLKAAAEKAGIEQWVNNRGEVNTADYEVDGGMYIDHICDCEIVGTESPRAEFIAMANPANILALVEALEKAQETIDELENDEARQRLANAEHQLYMAELAKNNLRASRKAQFRKRKAAEQRIAELESRTVKLPKPYAYLRENDGQIQISIGAERPSDRSGGYATPWFAIYTAAGIKVEAE